MSKLRAVCFTINNPKDISKVKDFLSECKYAIIGEEVGESGTPHLQGYAEWKNPKSFKVIHQGLEKGHLERRKGTRWQASEYCRKDGVVWEIGEPPEEEMRAGKRTDLDNIKEYMDENMSIRQMVDEGVCRNYQGIRMAEKLLEYFEQPRTWRPEVHFFYGASGTGKSFTARAEAKSLGCAVEDIYFANANGKWWNGYDRHEFVIIDDFRYDYMKFSDLLKLLDETPYRVETKGGMRQFVARHIWISCPRCPRDEFKYHAEEDLAQLTSRCKSIRKFSGVNMRLEKSAGTQVVEQRSGGNTNPLLDIEAGAPPPDPDVSNLSYLSNTGYVSDVDF